jgi:hypothetical protein
MIGQTLAHYEVLSALGRGGMGEVWRARDTKLGREVAIKTLPEEFARDADRLARFEREAKLLASLNHPNIAAIYGLEEHAGTHFLVLELIEGDTLGDRLNRGAIPLEDSLKLALQMADALEAAHDKGVIHRDLKPANIKVTPEGQLKVLDFGLAKALASDGDVGLSNSPTLSIAATQQGVILGTAGYMSPEQAKGEEAGKTADIWAFGIVLFEMLTGREVFGAPSVAESLAKILERDVPLDSLPADTPANIRRLLERCLDKDPKRRLQHIGDARIEITSPPEDPIATAMVGSVSRSRGAYAAVLILLLAVAGLVATRPSAPAPPAVRRFVVSPVQGSYIAPRAGPALSLDGRQLVFGVVDSERAGQSERLLIRNLEESFDLTVLIEGEAVSAPIFSPFGNEVAFDDGNGRRRVSSDGGTSSALVASGDTLGLGWINPDEVVLGLNWGFPLERTSLDGSATSNLTALDTSAGEQAMAFDLT